MNNYLFIHEDGLIEQKEVDDVRVYRDSVAAGILEVIRVQKYCTQFEVLQPDGSWKEV